MDDWKTVPCIIGGSRQSRAIWTRLRGDPGILWVLHYCHQELCWEVQHMYLGTAEDNERDAKEHWGPQYRSWTRDPRTYKYANAMSGARGWRPSDTYPSVVKAFVSEECVENGGVRVKATDLYNLYREWASNCGMEAMSKITFGQALGHLGYKRLASNSARWWIGLYPKKWPTPTFVINPRGR
jgi:hypothetical protein